VLEKDFPNLSRVYRAISERSFDLPVDLKKVNQEFFLAAERIRSQLYERKDKLINLWKIGETNLAATTLNAKVITIMTTPQTQSAVSIRFCKAKRYIEHRVVLLNSLDTNYPNTYIGTRDEIQAKKIDGFLDPKQTPPQTEVIMEALEELLGKNKNGLIHYLKCHAAY